jgi:hypothetical protein
VFKYRKYGGWNLHISDGGEGPQVQRIVVKISYTATSYVCCQGKALINLSWFAGCSDQRESPHWSLQVNARIAHENRL